MSRKYWIPHALTVSRMAAALVLGQQIVFAETAAGHLTVILALTGYIFLSDLLDGRLARKWACCSPVGAKLDIAADLLYIVSQDLILIWRGWMPAWVLFLVLTEFMVFSMTAKADFEQADGTAIRFDRIGRAAAVYYYLMPLLYLLLSAWDTGTGAVLAADLFCLVLTLAAVMSRFFLWNSGRGDGRQKGMIMKKFWMLIFSIVLIAGMAGCGARPIQNEASSSAETPVSSGEPAVDMIPKPVTGDAPDETQPAEITVIGLTQQQAAEYEAQGITLLGDGDSAYSSCFLVSFDRAVTELSLWRIEMDAIVNDSYICSETECIGSVQDLAPGDQVILAGNIGELLPTLGISYTAEEGVTVHDYLTVSGKDGSPILAAYEVADAEQPRLPG